MRSFVAVDISDEVISEIERFVSTTKAQLPKPRWVEPSNIHLTLRFLGEASDAALQAVTAAVESAARRCSRPFVLNFRGIGFFPSVHRPRVLWVGVPDPPAPFLRLQEEIESIAQMSGFAPEKRRFSPHLTLGRYGRPHTDPRFIQIAREWERHPFGTSRVGEVILYRSILRPQGTEYRALARLVLGG